MTPSMGFPGDDQRDVASGDVEAFLDEVRANLRTPVPRGTADRHVRAMVAAAGRPIPWWTLQSLRSSVAQPFGGAPRWAAALALTALFGSSALAATGNLPAPVQRVVADTVSHIGLDLPDPDDDAPGTDEDIDEGVDGSTEDDGVEDTDEVTTRTQPENHGSTVASVASEEFDSGCEHGQAVRDVASSAADPQGRGEGRGEDHDPCAKADGGEPTDSDAPEDGDTDTDESDGGAEPNGSAPENPGSGPPDHARTRSSGNAGGPQD